MSGWHDLFVAEVSASAALLGLVFVGISINLHQIMSLPNLPIRAMQTVGTLLTVLTLSSLLLVPDMPPRVTGAEILLVGLAGFAGASYLIGREWRDLEARYRPKYGIVAAVGEVALLFFIAAGGVVWARGIGGLYWVVPGIILCLLDASVNAWVLLIEINR